MRRINDDQRRARIAVRHALAPDHRVGSVPGATRAVVALHATEPASVHLAARARSGASRDEVDSALYDERAIVKQLAMRRTVFAFPRDLLPDVWGSASARVFAQQRRLLVKELADHGLAGDAEAFAEEHLRLVHELIADKGPMGTADVRAALPALDARITRGKGAYAVDVAIAGRVVTVLAAGGAIVRGANTGSWKVSRPLWTDTAEWLGTPPSPSPEPEAYAALVGRWLAAFGPGTEADLVWWLGATKAAVRAALATLGAIEVTLDSGETGWVLPDDEDEPAPGPWAALLPALDPTTMGWKQRDFYLGPHADEIFDANGNGGPTAWWDGRIVGGWAQDESGRVVVLPVTDLPRAAREALDAEAEALTAWLAGDVVRSIYQSPLARRHLAG